MIYGRIRGILARDTDNYSIYFILLTWSVSAGGRPLKRKNEKNAFNFIFIVRKCVLQSYITIEVIFLDLLIPGFLSQRVTTRST